jgi:hypothetical protein
MSAIDSRLTCKHRHGIGYGNTLIRSDGYLAELIAQIDQVTCHCPGMSSRQLRSLATLRVSINRRPDAVDCKCPCPGMAISGCEDVDNSAFVFESFHRFLVLVSGRRTTTSISIHYSKAH